MCGAKSARVRFRIFCSACEIDHPAATPGRPEIRRRDSAGRAALAKKTHEVLAKLRPDADDKAAGAREETAANRHRQWRGAETAVDRHRLWRGAEIPMHSDARRAGSAW